MYSMFVVDDPPTTQVEHVDFASSKKSKGMFPRLKLLVTFKSDLA